MRKFFRFLFKTLMWIVIFFFTSTILAVILQKMDGKEMTMHHTWVPLEEISPHMPVAVMASEDQRFLIHDGFDFAAIQEAIEYNRTHEKKRGASTISQQTAKNVFLWQGRSWVRKGLEAYFTFLIELCWSKQRIMEVYLNSIEMGHGIYGVEAVARDHFNTSAHDLTRSQCALIAATLPNPLKFNSAHPTPYMLKRQSAIQKQMRNVKLFPINTNDN